MGGGAAPAPSPASRPPPRPAPRRAAPNAASTPPPPPARPPPPHPHRRAPPAPARPSHAGAHAPARASTPYSNRGGATADQRTQAAEGCRTLDFDLPGYGHVRVVCGQEGRRDVWHNIFLNAVRYGYNVGRWSRNQRPPESVLAAIRERGVEAFH